MTAQLAALDTKTLIIVAQVNPDLRPAAEDIIFERTGGWVRISDNGVIPVDRKNQTFRKFTPAEAAHQAKLDAEAARIEREG